MRNLLACFILMLLFTSCDDGDILVTTFEFEDETFELCGNGRDKFLYHIKNTEVFESLTLQLNNPAFATGDNQLVLTEENIRIPLTGANLLTYRTYDAALPTARNAYFCGTNPPATPRVLQEYRSVGGLIIIRTVLINERYETLIEVENLQLQNQDADGGNISFTNRILGRYVTIAEGAPGG